MMKLKTPVEMQTTMDGLDDVVRLMRRRAGVPKNGNA